MTTDLDDDWTVTHTFDADDEPASEAVVRAVAAATNREALAIDPLYGTIETDALDSLFDADAATVSVTFPYAGCVVRVEDGCVVVHAESEE